MSKGLLAHIYATFLYFIVLMIGVYKNEDVDNFIRFILAFGYLMIQMGVAVICYIEGWYHNEK